MLLPYHLVISITRLTSTIGLVGASREDIFCGCPAMRMGLECASKSGSSRDNLKSVPLRYHIYPTRCWGPVANVARAWTPKFQMKVSTVESIASHLDYIAIIGRKRAGTPWSNQQIVESSIDQFWDLLSWVGVAINWLNLQLYFAKAALNLDDLVGSLTTGPFSTTHGIAQYTY